ncbi:MAG: argininosuccinate synthase [Deltaproteobacteria bacterium]|nr:argininosuccinate synthase [Deltaproteobacteria bacterium]
MKKIILAYSGGLDTSVILKWLVETYRCPVVAFVADIGQVDDLSGVEKKALATGAEKCVVENLQEEFVRDFFFPALRAAAVYEGSYLLGTSLARPLIAKAQIELAQREGADRVSHGATGKGNDQVRFELTYLALDPGIRIIAPWREWGDEFDSRESMIAYAQKHNIPVQATAAKPYSSDSNLLHISYEGGVLEDPWLEPEEDMFVMTRAPEAAPDRPQYVEVDFEAGVPVKVDGEALSPAALLRRLNEFGGEHGVGRVDLVENRFVGMKSRGVYETPGGTILHVAHRAVESLTVDREVLHLRDGWITQYATLVYNGFWYAPEREMLQAAIDRSQQFVTGTARVKLYKGSVTVAGRKAPRSLYRQDYATFEREEVFQQADATGFIRLNALRLKIQSMIRGGK